MYTNSYKTCLACQFYLHARKGDFAWYRSRLRALVVLVFTYDMHIQVAHALCERGCRLIIHTANKRIVTIIEACYNCPRSPLCQYVYKWRVAYRVSVV